MNGLVVTAQKIPSHAKRAVGKHINLIFHPFVGGGKFLKNRDFALESP